MGKVLTLSRFAHVPGYGVFGDLEIEGSGRRWHTVERPWLGNMPNRSCVPEGTYHLKPCRYNRGGYDAYELLSVPARTEIKIHKGNYPSDVQGCIAVGTDLGALYDKWAVLGSLPAFQQLMAAMEGEDGLLTIQSENLSFRAGG